MMMVTIITLIGVMIQITIAKLTCKKFVVANIKTSRLGSFILRVYSRLFVLATHSTEPKEKNPDPSKSTIQNLRYI